jgi:hypothetical protein
LAGTCRHWWTDSGSSGSAALCTLRNVLRARALRRRRSSRTSPADWRAVGIEVLATCSSLIAAIRSSYWHRTFNNQQLRCLFTGRICIAARLSLFRLALSVTWDGARPRLATHNDITDPFISRNSTAPAEHASRFYFDIQYFAMSIVSLSTSINILLGSDDAHHT